MLVTFTCEAHGDITLLGNDARRLLKMMGHSGTIPSAIYAEDVPAVLERLQNAVKAAQAAPNEKSFDDTDEDEQEEPRVNIAVRAFPLIEMLTAAAKENCNVMWY
jgi:hypothetical protein